MMRVLFVLLLCPLFSACRKDAPEPEDKYVQDYNVTFDYTTHHTRVDAIFNSGKSLLQENTTITCKGHSGHVATWYVPYTPHGSTTRYFYTWDMDTLSDIGLRLKKRNGNTYDNFVYQNEIESIGFTPSFDTVSLSQNDTIAFTGGPVTTGETVTVYVQQGGTSSSVTTAYPGDATILLPSSSLTGLTPGPATVHIQRRSSPRSLNQSDGSGGSRTIYATATQNVLILY